MRKFLSGFLVAIILIATAFAAGGMKKFSEDVLAFGSDSGSVRAIGFGRSYGTSSPQLSLNSGNTLFSLNKSLSVTGGLDVSGVTSSSTPCNKMTELDRDALTPTEGKCIYNTDTKVWNIYEGSIWKEAGAGGVGSPSIYALYNAEDNSVTGFTNITITAASPLAGTASYSVDSFPAAFPSVVIQPRNVTGGGKEHSVTIIYRLTSGTCKALMKDDSANLIGAVEFSATGDQKTFFSYFVRDSVVDVDLTFEDVSSCTGLIVDDVEYNDSPFSLANINQMTKWASDGVITLTGVTSDPVKGTIVRDDIKWRRVGDSMEIQYEYEQSGGGSVGSGTYLIEIPDGKVIDVTKLTQVASGYHSIAIGYGLASNTVDGISPNSRDVINSTYDSTHFQMAADNGADDGLLFVGSSSLGLSGQLKFSGKVTVPIVGWSATAEYVITPASVTTESALYQQYTAYSATNTAIPYFTTEKINTISKCGTIDNSATLGWSYTALKKCEIKLILSTAASGGTFAGLTLDGTELSTNINTLTDDSQIVGFSYQSASNSGDTVGFIGILDVGQVLRPQLDKAAVSPNEHRVHLSITATPSEVTMMAATPTVRHQLYEVPTGKFWIDGREIYRKSYEFTGKSATFEIDNISSIEPISYNAMATSTGDLKTYTLGDTVSYNITYLSSTGGLDFVVASDTWNDVKITIEYVK